MDRVERTIDVVKALNHYNQGLLEDHLLIKKVCSYFDYIKDQKLSNSDKAFLIYLSNKSGIPHYFDMLKISDNNIDLMFTEEDVDLNTFASIYFETNLHTDENSKLHKYQKEVLDKFEKGSRNRYFLSASTSFGKTHLTYEIIKKMEYKNVVLIFPTIALLSENLSKLKEKPQYAYFKENYSIHTLSEGREEYGAQNIFIYTPERFLSFLDKNENKVDIEFVFVDEVYKIDNEYVDNDEKEIKEHERDLAYRMAIFYALQNYRNTDSLFAGPYITFSKEGTKTYNNSFDLFLKNYEIELIDKNNYEIVNKTISSISSRQTQIIDQKPLSFVENGRNITGKIERLRIVLSNILKNNYQNETKTIIYCNTKVSVEKTSKSILSWGIMKQSTSNEMLRFIKHLETTYNNEWCVITALKNNIGIHHGVVPKYIQKEIVNFFNINDAINVLICTTTITEGVNTSAKNLITLFDTKGTKKLKAFDAKNIAGRAGRFMEHYKGVVISIQNKFESILNATEDGIKHKNFDLNLPKDGVDLEMTNEDFLSLTEKIKRDNIKLSQDQRQINEDILKQFKAVSREDKILIYDRITMLNNNDHLTLKNLVIKIQQNQIDFDGFKTFVTVVLPIVRDKNFLFLLEKSKKLDGTGLLIENEYPRITYLLYYYLKDGFQGLFNYRLKDLGESVDDSMRKTSELVYNTFKYQLVKYLGVFNLMYKYHLTKTENKKFDEVTGFDKLLMKLEYNAFSDQAKIASDFGVPQKIIDFYDSNSPMKKDRIYKSFDDYEAYIYEKTKKIFE